MGVGGEYKKQDWDSESVTVLVCDSDEEGEEICSELSLECSETLVFYTSGTVSQKISIKHNYHISIYHSHHGVWDLVKDIRRIINK